MRAGEQTGAEGHLEPLLFYWLRDWEDRLSQGGLFIARAAGCYDRAEAISESWLSCSTTPAFGLT
jgi:hypothetical protein